MRKLLFSPLGDTDPVRGMRDGACLHIIRHYRPDKVILFYTAEIEEKKKKDDRFVKAIRSVDEHVEIGEIFSGIENPHLYDEFIDLFHSTLESLHLEEPDAEILLNLSSATPQIKTMMAMIAAENKWCRGIQVSTPEKKSNKYNHAATEQTVMEEIELNEDNEPSAPNRCSEPPLKAIRYHNERNQLEALLENYEYKGALTLARSSVSASKDTIALLKHAAARVDFDLKSASEHKKSYKGKSLFPIWNGKRPVESDKYTKLAEYYMLIYLAKERRDVPEILLRTSPFLDDMLNTFVSKYSSIKISELLDRRKLSSSLIAQRYPELMRMLDSEFGGSFIDKEPSFKNLKVVCKYIAESDAGLNHTVCANMSELAKEIEKCSDLRNLCAHNVDYFTSDKFYNQLDLTVDKLVDILFKMLQLTIGESVLSPKYKSIYKDINRMVVDSLDKAK